MDPNDATVEDESVENLENGLDSTNYSHPSLMVTGYFFDEPLSFLKNQTSRKYGPVLEAVFQIPLAMGLYNDCGILTLLAIAALLSVLFGLSHHPANASGPQQVFLMVLHLGGFTGLFVLPWILFMPHYSMLGVGILLSIYVHYAYNKKVRAMRRSEDTETVRKGHLLPLASIASP